MLWGRCGSLIWVRNNFSFGFNYHFIPQSLHIINLFSVDWEKTKWDYNTWNVLILSYWKIKLFWKLRGKDIKGVNTSYDCPLKDIAYSKTYGHFLLSNVLIVLSSNLSFENLHWPSWKAYNPTYMGCISFSFLSPLPTRILPLLR